MSQLRAVKVSELRTYRGRKTGVDLSENGLAHKLACWGLACQLLSALFLLPVAGDEPFAAESGNAFLAQARIILYGLEETSAEHTGKTDVRTVRSGLHPPLADICCGDGGNEAGVCVSVRGKDMTLMGIPVASSVKVHLTDEADGAGHILSVSLTGNHDGAARSGPGDHEGQRNPDAIPDTSYSGVSVAATLLQDSWPFRP